MIDGGTPLIANGMQLLPTGSNVFEKSGMAFCYFEIYTPAPAESPSLRIRILDRKTGAAVWDGGEAKLDPSSAKSVVPAGLSLPIESLTPGAYRLEVTATEGPDQTARQTVDFEMR